MATKTSILIFYLRLSRNTQQVLRIASWIVLGVVNVSGTVLTIMNIFQCNPVGAAFDLEPGTGTCIPLLTEFICSAPVNIISDLAILALPLPVLTGMRLPSRQKVILIFTFGLGVFVTIVDVVRIYYLQRAITDVTPRASDSVEATFGGQRDFAYNASLSFMWSAVEVNIGIACACIPTLKPLIVRILPTMIIDPDGTLRSSHLSSKPNSDGTRHMSDDSRAHATTNLSPIQEGQVATPEPAQTWDNPNTGVDAMEFLTTPEMGSTRQPRGIHRTNTATTSGGNSVYFGFVNLSRPKSLVRTSKSDSFKYCTVVGVLFVLWGFSYGLLNTLNNVIAASVAGVTMAQTLGLTSMYFGAGYFFGPLVVGEWILRHDEHRRVRSSKNQDGSMSVGGFKATFMLGLCIYGIGTIMFWPSAVLLSFTGFMICNFVVGFGLAVLETAANPYLALCGPIDYAEMRLLIAQGVQAVATVLSQYLAQRVFFDNIGTEPSDSFTLRDVQWTYLAITLFCAILALIFYYMPLPEVTDTEMEHTMLYFPVDPTKRSIGGFELRTWTLGLAVMAQWFYVAGQESLSVFLSHILAPESPQSPGRADGLTIPPSKYFLIAHTAFAVSRFIAGYLAYLSPTHPRVPQPRTILHISTALSVLFSTLVAAVRPSNPNALAAVVILMFLAEGPMWPLIFALGLRGQGRRTKRAAAWITMGASGPAFWPFVIYGISRAGAGYQTAFAVVPGLLAVALAFPLFLDLKRDARALVDARVGEEEQSRIQATQNCDVDLDTVITARRRNPDSFPSHYGHGLAGRILDAVARNILRRPWTRPTREKKTTMTTTEEPGTKEPNAA